MRKPCKVRQALQTEELVLLMHVSVPVRLSETQRKKRRTFVKHTNTTGWRELGRERGIKKWGNHQRLLADLLIGVQRISISRRIEKLSAYFSARYRSLSVQTLGLFITVIILHFFLVSSGTEICQVFIFPCCYSPRKQAQCYGKAWQKCHSLAAFFSTSLFFLFDVFSGSQQHNKQGRFDISPTSRAEA